METNDDGLDPRIELCVVGEIDNYSVQKLEEVFNQALKEANTITIDLAGVSFIGSAGVTALYNIYSLAIENNSNLDIKNPSPTAQKTFELCGVTEHLPISYDQK